MLIVDYKTDSLEGTDPEALVDAQYSIQRLIYALAALRVGAPAVEVAYCFLERPDAPVGARVWTAGDAAALEGELLDSRRASIEGRFEPHREPHLHLCAQLRGPAEPLLVGRGGHLARPRRYARSVSAEPDQQQLIPAGIEGFDGSRSRWGGTRPSSAIACGR